MGGYDRCLFKNTDSLPTNPKDFWNECKRKMFIGYGADEERFNSIWHNEESDFTIFWSDYELWGMLNW